MNWEDVIETGLRVKSCKGLCNEARGRKLAFMIRNGLPETAFELFFQLQFPCDWCLLSHRLRRQRWHVDFKRSAVYLVPCKGRDKGYSWTDQRHWLLQYQKLINGAY